MLICKLPPTLVKPLLTELWSILHSPDLAHSDCRLLGSLKDALRDCHFTSDWKVTEEVHAWLVMQPKLFFFYLMTYRSWLTKYVWMGWGLNRKWMILYIFILIVSVDKMIICGYFLIHLHINFCCVFQNILKFYKTNNQGYYYYCISWKTDICL